MGRSIGNVVKRGRLGRSSVGSNKRVWVIWEALNNMMIAG